MRCVQARKVVMRGIGNGGKDPVHPSAAEDAQVGKVLARIGVTVPDDQVVAAGEGGILHAPDHLAVVRVGDIVDDHADGARTAGDKAARKDVRLVVERLDGFKHPLARSRRQPGEHCS